MIGGDNSTKHNMPQDTRSIETPKLDAGPYLARIVSALDPKNMGTLQVQLLKDVGNLPNRTGNIYTVKYLSPFYGVTGIQHLGANQTFNDTQKSYGLWMIPPDPGSLVMVIFVEGNVKDGYWIGCVQDEHMNFMIPGLAATSLNTQGNKKLPVAEYNKRLNGLEHADSTQIKKPVHPFASVLSTQGLIDDETRGITSSSARREAPSCVFGISTPGPIDKSSGAPRGNIGKHESKISGAFVSRLGGTTFVMDDGDDRFVRASPADSGPPVYTDLENGAAGGQSSSIPHNELVRIRTRTGHQILLHNSEDLIYIGNAKGTSWIELTSNGKIDIYAGDSISIHTENDFNITADRDINLTAGRNVNINSGGTFAATAEKNYEIKAGAAGNLTTGKDSNIKAGGNHIETATKIHMNGPGASEAADALKASRVPQHEPWAGHENLNPGSCTPDKTSASSSPVSPVANYPKTPDTFSRNS